MEQAIKQRVEARKEAKKAQEADIKLKYYNEKELLLRNASLQEHHIVLCHMDELKQKAIALLSTKATDEQKPQIIDSILQYTQITEFTSIFSKQIRELDFVLGGCIGIFFTKKANDIAKIKQTFDDKYKKLKHQLEAKLISEDEYQTRLREIKSKENEKINDIEVESSHQQA